jgi:hypothetical protein
MRALGTDQRFQLILRSRLSGSRIRLCLPKAAERGPLLSSAIERWFFAQATSRPRVNLTPHITVVTCRPPEFNSITAKIYMSARRFALLLEKGC